jgi:zinc protease
MQTVSSKLLWAIAATFCVAGAPVSAADTPPAPLAVPASATAGVSKATQLATVEGITEYRLPNGLRVLLAPDTSKPTTTVNITYLVGSRHENYGETGMAHLLEHLVFKGTPTQGNIMTELGKRGMDFNGTTFTDRTNYYQTFPASDDNLQWVLTMEADRMVNSFIARADLEKEFSVVRNELERGENNPKMVLYTKLIATSFDWHNYGKSTIGARSDVENVKIENLQAFYRKYYQPDNAVLTVTGKFDAEKTLQSIEKAFGPIAKPARVLAPTYTLDPARDGAREVTVNRVADTYLVAALYPTAAGAHPDSVAIAALGEILASPPAGRLHKALVERKKASQTSVWAFDFAEPGYMIFWAELSKDQSMPEARKLMLEQLENVKKQPITAAELQRAKASILSDIDNTINNAQSLAIALSESISKGDWRLFFLTRDRVEALTAADIQRVAENYLKESNRTLGQFIPTKTIDRTTIPATPDVAQLVANYQGKAKVAEGEVFDIAPEAIEKRTLRQTLPNGLKLVMVPKKTRAQAVAGEIVLEFGDEKTLLGQATALDLASNMLLRGAGKRSRTDISTELDTLKTKLRISSQGQTLALSFETVRSSLPALMALIRDVLRAPTFVPAEFEQLREQSITFTNTQRSEPNAIASNGLARALNPYKRGDIRYMPSFDERIADYKAAKLADVKKLYSNMAGTKAGHFSLVGDFDAKEIEASVRMALGDWNNKSPFKRIAQPANAPKPASVLFETPDKANALFLAGLPVALQDDAPDYDALLLANEILGGGTQSRLWERLRQKDGLSYGVGSQVRASGFEPNGQITLYAIFAPQNREKVQAAVKEEVSRLLGDGITEAELLDAKKSIEQQRKTGRAQDPNLAWLHLNNSRIGRTMAFSAQSDARIARLTVAEVNAALKKYLDPAKLHNVFAGDFAGAAKKSEISK